MMAEGVIQPREDYVHFYYAKDHIEERLRMYVPEYSVWYSPERLWHTFISVLSEESEDYFERHVSQLCQQLSPEAVTLQHLNQRDLHEVWKKLEDLWPLPEKPVFSNNTNAYIFCKRSLEGAQETCVQAHIKILEDLFTMICRYGPTYQISQVTELLSLSLWLFHFYSKKKERSHRNYNSTVHVFHSDLVVTFLALKCRFSSAYLEPHRIPALPKLKRSIIHHGISPEDPPFQRLILQQMLIFLNPHLICGDDFMQNNPENIALFVCLCLSPGNWLWQKKGTSGILTIVKDQSRYMTLRQPIDYNLQRNFVADNVRRELSAKVKGLEQEIHRIMPLLPEPNTLQALEIFRAKMEEAECRAIDDGSRLPRTPSKQTRRVLNWLHHLLLIDLCKDVLGDNCPRINVKGRFEEVKFLNFLRDLAHYVIQYAFSISDDSKCRKKYLYPFIAKIAVVLQQIIAARWYICEVEQGSIVQIQATNELKQHLEVLFVFLAFRSLLMYFLPQNPAEYGVQRVPLNLPKYAKQVRLHLPLLFC